jgi:hypothetical protein
MRVVMVCPNCGRKHPRSIKNGQIIEYGSEPFKEEILVPKSAYSKESLLSKMKRGERDGVIIGKDAELNLKNPAAEAILRERWLESYGG